MNPNEQMTAGASSDQMVIGAIREKWLQLGGSQSFLGEPLTEELTCPDGIGRYNQFQGGFIYWTPATGAHEVHGDILAKWASLPPGYERSFLGYPVTDEMGFPEGGKVSVFERGAIYWWPDVGAIELNDVAVHYKGIACFGETNDQLSWVPFSSSSDEPYAVLGVMSPNGATTIRSTVYGDVDTNESRPDTIEIYRGKPNGLAISLLLMENDTGDPNKYKDEMQKALVAAAPAVGTLVALIPVVGPVIAAPATALYTALAPELASVLNNALNLGDDRIGEEVLPFTARQMVMLAARTPHATFNNIVYKLESSLIARDGGKYKAYFSVEPA